MTPSSFIIVAANGAEPAAMAMDTRGPLRDADPADAVRRVRRAAEKNIAQNDVYVRDTDARRISEDNEHGVYARAVVNPNRWKGGEEAAAAILSVLTPERVVDILRAAPAERQQMLTYLGDTLAPRPQAASSPFLGPQAARRAQPVPHPQPPR